MKPTVGFISLGCPKNRLDTEVMLGLLQEAGYAIVPEDAADILVVNTCGFIQAAKEEAIQTTLEAARYKQHGSCRVLIMAGCFSQRYVNQLIEELPEVDFFIGLDDVPHIVQICQRLEQEEASDATADQSPRPLHARMSDTLARARPSTYLYDAHTPRLPLGASHTAYIKIAEGCRFHCSFCIIPAIRGRLRSRPISSIVEEAAALAQQGVQELLLIGQDTTSYGVDLTGKPLIVPLLEALTALDALRWIRLMYAYPTNLSTDLLRLIAASSTICSYLDLPLQHIDTGILTRMKRGITEPQTRKLLDRLRREIPGLILRTSFIVGFPGEDDAAFQKLEDFVREYKFDRVGVFTYSREDGTPAYDMPDQVPTDVAEARQQRVLEVQQAISLAKHQAMLGTVQTVLIDGVSDETPLLLEGRTAGQAPEIDGVVYINEGHTTPGAFENVRITEAFPYDLVGKIV